MKRFFTITAVILILYFFGVEYANNFNINSLNKNSSDTPNENQRNEYSFFERTMSNILANILKTPQGQEAFVKMIQPMGAEQNNISDMVFKINNRDMMNRQFQIETNGPANARKAICGSNVDIEYTIKDFSSGSVETKRENIQLGGTGINLSLSNVIIGMSEGQVRKVVIPYKNDKSKSQMPTHMEITLHKILDRQYLDESKIRIFDNEVSNKLPYLCGEKINCAIKISKIDGTMIFQSKAGQDINYKIGDNEFPVIFGYGIFNKMKSGTRTIIAPASYFKTFTNNLRKDFNITNLTSEYYIVDIKNDN